MALCITVSQGFVLSIVCIEIRITQKRALEAKCHFFKKINSEFDLKKKQKTYFDRKRVFTESIFTFFQGFHRKNIVLVLDLNFEILIVLKKSACAKLYALIG